GGDGSDLIHGGSGDDTLSGGAGNDTIWSGSGGNDVIDGGAGNDTVSYGADPGDGYGDGVYVDLGTGIVEKNGWSSSDTLTSIENATGSAYNDELHASGDGSILKGGDGDDTLFDGNG